MAINLNPDRRIWSPNHGADRSSTRAIILHSTRGGAIDSAREYEGTINWFMNPNSQVSAHAVIAKNGEWTQCLDWDSIGWHAGAHNSTSIGIEIVQSKQGEYISDGQYTTCAQIIKELFNHYGELELIEHKNTIQGINAGKSDIGWPFNIETLRFFMEGNILRTAGQQNIINVLNGWSGGSQDSSKNLVQIADWLDCGALHEQAENLRQAAKELTSVKEILEQEWPQ